MTSMDDKLQALVSDMEIFGSRSFFGGTKHMQIRCSSRQLQHVPSSTPSPRRSVPANRYRDMMSELENYDSLPPQIEMPVSHGINPSVWISEVERFFSLGHYPYELDYNDVKFKFEYHSFTCFCIKFETDHYTQTCPL